MLPQSFCKEYWKPFPTLNLWIIGKLVLCPVEEGLCLLHVGSKNFGLEEDTENIL